MLFLAGIEKLPRERLLDLLTFLDGPGVTTYMTDNVTKFVNNILHYIIKSNNSNEIILSQFAIEKDFISTKQLEEHNNKKNYIKAFKKQIKKILPLKSNS